MEMKRTCNNQNNFEKEYSGGASNKKHSPRGVPGAPGNKVLFTTAEQRPPSPRWHPQLS